jgi:hypothetical protein
MALNINPIVNQLFTGVSTAGGFSFRDMKELGFFEPGEPVSFGSCFLDYTVGIGSDPYDPIIGVSTYNTGIKSTGTMGPLDLIGAVRELKLEISGSGQKIDLRNLAFGSEQTNNIRKTVAITTSCVISSDDTDVAALSLSGGYNNLRIFVDGQVLGCGGTGGGAGLDGDPTDRASDNGRDGGNALDIVNSLGIAAKIAVSATGAIKAGGGGGGAGEDGLNGEGVSYRSGTNTIQNLCNKGCNASHCGNGRLAACYTWDPFRDLCECQYDTYSISSGGIRGLGGAGGRGRGADFPSGSRDGLPASEPGLTDDYGGTAGSSGGRGGGGGDYGQVGEPGQYAPATGIATGPVIGDTYGYNLGIQRENDFRAGTPFTNITGLTSINVTVTYNWTGSNGGGLSQSVSLRRSQDNSVVASNSGGGTSGSFNISVASLDPNDVYYLYHTASSFGSTGFAEIAAYGSVTFSGTTPIVGGGGPGLGGQPGFAITGAYGLSGFVAGIITGILPPATFGFTTSANATVGYAGTQEVWEFTSIGSTEMSLSKTQRVDLLVVGGGSQTVSGGRGGGGGRVEYRQLLTFPGGSYTVSVGNYGQSTSIAHVDGTSLSITANGANSSSSQGAQVIVYDGLGNEPANEVTNTVYASQGSGGDSIQVHGPEAYGGGGGATQGGGGGSHSGGVCWRAYPGGGDRDCGTGPYSSRGGRGGNGLQVNVRISQTAEYYGSGGGGAAGESGNCNGPDCGVSVSQGPMGPGQYGRGRRPNGQNHGSPINATQGILVIKYLDNLP